MVEFLNPIFFGFLAGFSTILGVLLILYFERFTRKYSSYFISFAAGILLASAFFHIIPESIELNDSSLFIVLAGFLIFYLIEHFLISHSHSYEKERESRESVFGKIGAIGIAFHSLIDGIAIGAGFEISKGIGLIVSLSVIMHEIPEGITALSILIHSKMKRAKSILFSLLVAIATPIGALITVLFVKNISENLLGALLALAAGSFIYIGASDLIPETRRKFTKLNAVMLVLGIILLYLIGKIFLI